MRVCYSARESGLGGGLSGRDCGRLLRNGGKAMIRKTLKALVAIILAVIVFYISFAWTASCRMEREMVRAEIKGQEK